MDRRRVKLAWGRLLVAARLRDPFRQALVSGDVEMLQGIWSKVTGMPAPESVQEAEIQMHIARTTSTTIPLQQRSYSHFWLKDRGLPSLLPPELFPKAEAYRPEVQSAVAIALGSGKTWLQPALKLIGLKMAETVRDNAELIERDPDLLRDKILFAKKDEFKRLFGVETALEVER